MGAPSEGRRGRQDDRCHRVPVPVEPATISVAQVGSVRLRLHSADRSHAFAIKAFRVKALIPKGGETVTVEFVADQAGTFAFTCSEYCGTGHSEMKGMLVVRAEGK